MSLSRPRPNICRQSSMGSITRNTKTCCILYRFVPSGVTYSLVTHVAGLSMVCNADLMTLARYGIVGAQFRRRLRNPRLALIHHAHALPERFD